VQQHLDVVAARTLGVGRRERELLLVLRDVPRHEVTDELELPRLEEGLVEHRDLLVADADADVDPCARARGEQRQREAGEEDGDREGEGFSHRVPERAEWLVSCAADFSQASMHTGGSAVQASVTAGWPHFAGMARDLRCVVTRVPRRSGMTGRHAYARAPVAQLDRAADF
jgi:hypothetical protein